MQRIEITTKDGARVAARVFPCDQPQATVLLPTAMGAKQEFYAPFAQWLSAQGYLVVSFDYRGVGDSRTGSLRGFKADLFDWSRDFESMVDWLKGQLPAAPLYVVGHSLGAQLPGMLANRDQIAGLISVAAGSGYWRDNAPPTRRMILYFWHVLVPLATQLFGYFPGKRLRKVGDLPAGVILQWRRWCLNPLYSFGAEGDAVRNAYGSVRFPVLALSITDDEMMTLRGTRTLVEFYANAPRRIEQITPADANVAQIGHFGFFRQQFESTLWPRIPAALQAFAH
jgi:predicted alpha/beta hydrolase